jgi:hypothetical protein
MNEKEQSALQEIISQLERFPKDQQDKILQSAQKMLVGTKDSRVNSAWRYHQNADTIQHQRHIIFILAQTIFFTGFAVSKNQLIQGLVLGLGLAFAFLWWRVACLLEKRLDAMRAILREDPIWQIYIDAVKQKALFGGRCVFNWWLPGLTFLGWISVIIYHLYHLYHGRVH